MKTYAIKHTPMKVLLEPIYFEYNGVTEKIPAGYAFDGLSIPQIFQNVVNMNSTNNTLASLYHDYFFSLVCDIPITRKQADMRLLNDIEGLGRYLIYIGVRLGGWYSWKQDRNYKKYKIQIDKARKQLLSKK